MLKRSRSKNLANPAERQASLPLARIGLGVARREHEPGSRELLELNEASVSSRRTLSLSESV